MAKTQQQYREAVTQMFRDADEDKEGIVDKKELTMVFRALGSWEDSRRVPPALFEGLRVVSACC